MNYQENTPISCCGQSFRSYFLQAAMLSLFALMSVTGCKRDPAGGAPAATQPAKTDVPLLNLEQLPTVADIVGTTWRRTQSPAVQKELAPVAESLMGVHVEKWERDKLEQAVALAGIAENEYVATPSAERLENLLARVDKWLKAEQLYWEAIVAERRLALIRSAGRECEKAGLRGGEGKAMLHYQQLAGERDTLQAIHPILEHFLTNAVTKLQGGAPQDENAPTGIDPALKCRLDQLLATILPMPSGEALSAERKVAVMRAYRSAVHLGSEYIVRASFRAETFEQTATTLAKATLAAPDAPFSGASTDSNRQEQARPKSSSLTQSEPPVNNGPTSENDISQQIETMLKLMENKLGRPLTEDEKRQARNVFVASRESEVTLAEGSRFLKIVAAGDVAGAKAAIRVGPKIVHFKDKMGTPALQHAAFAGKLEMVKLLLDSGARVDDRGYDDSTALHSAAEKGHIEVARLLVERGADVNAKLARSFSLEGRDVSVTPLLLATTFKHTELAEFLRAKGAK